MKFNYIIIAIFTVLCFYCSNDDDSGENINLEGQGQSLLAFTAFGDLSCGEITITSGTTNVYTSVSFSLDTNTLPMPAAGFNHIMISNSHLPFEDFGRMFVGFDNFCLIN